MAKKTDLYVVCVDIETAHHDAAVVVKCSTSTCRRLLWCTPWNQDKKPICIPCTQTIKKPKFLISCKDVTEARKEIKKRKQSEN